MLAEFNEKAGWRSHEEPVKDAMARYDRQRRAEREATHAAADGAPIDP